MEVHEESDSSSDYCCSDPECDFNVSKRKQQRFVYIRNIIIFLVLGYLALQLHYSLQDPLSEVNNYVRAKLDQPTLNEFFIGNVKAMGHVKEEVLVCANDMQLKDVMVNLVTQYQACGFLELAIDWPAIEKWKDDQYLLTKIGGMSVLAEKRPGVSQFSELGRNWRMKHTNYSDYFLNHFGPGDKYRYLLYDQPLPLQLLPDIQEPPVMSQLFKSENVTFWDSYNYKTYAHSRAQDQLICVVYGGINITLATPWERELFYPDQRRPNVSPVNISNPNLNLFPEFRFSTTYTVDLEKGDCLYIPSFWWQQIDSVPERSIGVTFWYPTSSDWLKLTFEGIEQGLI